MQLRSLLLLAMVAAPSSAVAQTAIARPVSAEVAAREDLERRRELGRVMSALARESRIDAERIEAAYGIAARGAGLRNRAALQTAITEGAISTLPSDVRRFNVAPRLAGWSPIGEKDLGHQYLYVAAHPATLGLLFHVAARAPAPLDVTSLVRHHDYQQALGRTNVNARTSAPTHTLGLAFDISVLHLDVSEAVAIRDVLRRMRSDGDLFFVAETRQLVFHVVPSPERLAFYAAVHDGLVYTRPPLARWSTSEALRFIPSAPPDPDTVRIEADAKRLAAAVPPAAFASLALLGTLIARAFRGARRARRRIRPRV